jgi:soluble lytic murein transglycosylase-like protein
LLGACAASWAALSIAPASAQTIRLLSDEDAAAYAQAFQAASQGDFDDAEHAAAAASDKSLVGYLEFQRLMWRGTVATYDDLKSWLANYADLPGADRILQLARRRRPPGEPELRTPAALSFSSQSDFLPPSTARGQAAREAYYSGYVERARRLAAASGEHWIAGLAAFRLGDYDAAVAEFRKLALDSNANDWLRSGAAYWAARSAISGGQPELAPDFLAIASRSPWTFYGILAERQLGLEAGADPDAYVLAQAGLAPAPPSASDGEFVKAAYASVTGPELNRLISEDPHARRAAELAQIGRTAEAGRELRTGLLSAQSESERNIWTTLALELNSSAVAQARSRQGKGFDPDDFPTPDLQPDGGFTLDKALVFAVIRQESRFNAYAVSGAGAMGLMQVTPQTAVTATGDSRLLGNPLALFDAPTNLRIGQDYLALLMKKATDGDLLRALAAYNSGPGVLLRTEQAVGDDDPLLLMESMPAGETRAYVERVMANYWIYRRIFGQTSRSIDAVASGARIVGPTVDR